MQRIVFEAWCYRCRERESGPVTDEQEARDLIERFRAKHRARCGASASIGSQIQTRLPQP